MKTRELLTTEQREYFYSIPDVMDERETLRYYTISHEELRIINKQRGAANRLGFAIQIAYLRFPGRPLSSNEKVPDFIVHTIAKQLRVLPSAIQNYARERDATRREHLIKIRNTLGFRTFTLKEYRELARWLLPIAMKTDKGHLLVEALIIEMRKRKIILPAIYAIEHLAWATRERAHRRVFKQLTKGLTSSQCKKLDKLLNVEKGYKYSYLSWLRQPSGVFSELCNHLRSGDMWVVGSKQYKDFEEYLLPPEKWCELRDKSQIPLAISTNMDQYLQERYKLMEKQFSKVNHLIKNQLLEDVAIYAEKIQVTPLKKMIPNEVTDLTRLIYNVLPRIKLTELLVEVDSWTNFSKHFVHLHAQSEPKDKSVLFAAILADGINLGLSKMADACPNIAYSQLAWISDWYIRDENYSKALGAITDFQHKHPFSSYWGDGSTSSSDGQFFRAGGQSSPLAQVNAKYGRDPGVSFYTHISDQYAPFYVQVISSSEEAPHIIDGLLYHETDLKIEEHYTDAAGFVDHVFGMCHMLGFRFAPRIKTISKNKIYTFDKPTKQSNLEFMIGGTIQVKKIEENWDDLLRLISSVRNGTVTASLILKKLAAYPRQNSLSVALREIGRIERTLYTLEWLQSPELRRHVHIGLNKGEAKHALARAVFFNRLGEIRDRSYEDQLHRASGLQLLISAIVLWNTVYISHAVDALRAKGVDIPEEHLQHISPLGWEHITLTGDYVWNLNQKTNFNSLRPLRDKNSIKKQ
ncbi:Tn3 family transposase (plasmid) [Bacillus bombysepticus]